MIPESFEYHAPTSLDEALALLKEHGDDAKVLAGGHSLIPTMKLRLAQPAIIIDINKIDSLKGITESNGKLIIGGLTTHHQLESSELVRGKISLLGQTAAEIGDAQVRNKGTIGGSLAHADPAADWPAAVLALDAEIKATGPSGERTIKVGEFFQGLFTTALDPQEILTAVEVPITQENTKGTYLKLHQVASGFALAGVAVLLTRSGDNCEKIAVGITGVADTPYRATDVEAALSGKALDGESIAAAAAEAANGVDALEDIHASGAYRENLAKVYTRRAIESSAS